MSARTGSRIAITAGAGLLCAGVAVPAMANGTDHAQSRTHRPSAEHRTLSFAEQKGLALASLAREAQWLNGLKAKVAADSKLTAAQQAAFTAELDKALAAVAAARSAAESASTPAELRAAMQQAELPLMTYPRHHRDHGQVVLTVARANDPSRVVAHRSVIVDRQWRHDRVGDRSDRRAAGGRHCSGDHHRDGDGWGGFPG